MIYLLTQKDGGPSSQIRNLLYDLLTGSDNANEIRTKMRELLAELAPGFNRVELPENETQPAKRTYHSLCTSKCQSLGCNGWGALVSVFERVRGSGSKIEG